MKGILIILFFVGLTTTCAGQPPAKLNNHGSWENSRGFDKDGNHVIYENAYRWVDETTDPEIRKMIDSLFAGIPENFDPISQDMEAFLREVPYFSHVNTDHSDPSSFSTEQLESYFRNNSRLLEQSDMDRLIKEIRRLREEYERHLQLRSKSGYTN